MVSMPPASKQPIPDDAHVEYSGRLFSVMSWVQPMFDGSSERFEKVVRPDSVAVLPVVANKIRILHEEQPGSLAGLGVIGGRVDEGESPTDAAIRELYEEAGLIAGRMDHLMSYQSMVKVEWTTHLYMATDCREATQPAAPDRGERIRTIDVDWDALLELVTDDRFANVGVAFQLLRAARRASGSDEAWVERLLAENMTPRSSRRNVT